MKIATAFCFSAILLGAVLQAGSADAALPARTWVSGTAAGVDSNPCSRSQPCATFAGAYAKTAPGGEIDVLDSGEFGTLYIDHSITIANDGAATAAITVINTFIDVEPTSSAQIVLRGLNMNGVGDASFAITFIAHADSSLLIDHCTVHGYANSAITMQPSNNFSAKMWIRDAVLSNDGSSSTGALFISNNNIGGAMSAQIERVRILGATGNGIRVDGTGGGVMPIDVELHDVTVDGSSGGSAIVAVSLTSGGPTVKIVADTVTASHNVGYGFRAVGGTATVTLSRSVIENNGVGIGESTGGVVYSYGDNRFANNSSGDGVAPTPIGLK